MKKKKIKKDVKPKTIVICTPGSSFSHTWVNCLLNLWLWCYQNGYTPRLSQATSNNTYYVRQKCLGADVMRGKDQKPFDGKLDYDYILWIDSDSIFAPQQLDKLLKHNVDIVAGLQAFEGGQGFTCGNLNEDYFKKKGIMPYHTQETIDRAKPNKKGLIEVDYTGFGFLLVKKGVYEKLEYPWHRPEWWKIDKCVDFSMEDVGWSMNVRKKGYKIYVDPTIRVGHEKKTIY